MTAAYNNADCAARFICGGQHSSCSVPFCRSLQSAPVDAIVMSIILQYWSRARLRAVLRLPPICKPSAPAWSNSGVNVWNARNTKPIKRVAATPGPNPEPVGGANAQPGLGGSFGRTAPLAAGIVPIANTLGKITPGETGAVTAYHRVDEPAVFRRRTSTEPACPGNLFLISSHWLLRSSWDALG